MALIQLGPLAAQVSGSIGGTTFAHNRGGQYARVRVVPRKVESAYTIAVRDVLSQCSQLWGTLTDAQRQAWREYSVNTPVVNRLGMTKTLAGHVAFNKLNARLLQQGVSSLDLPPTAASPDTLTAFSVVIDKSGDNDALATFAPTPLGASKHLWVWAAIPGSAGAQYVANKWRLIYKSAANVATGADLLPGLEARFGTLQAGQHVVFQAQVLDATSGLVSAFYPAYALVG